MKYRTLLASVVVSLATSLASAHPMGNFSVNRYARLEPSAEGITVLYLVDFAEIPTFQEISRFPSLVSDPAAASLNRASERSALAAELAATWIPGLEVRSSVRPIRLRATNSSIDFAPGAGGLPTMKLRLLLAGTWPRGTTTETLHYEDRNSPDRLGWREVVVHAGRGLKLSGDFSTADRSRELTDYPADPTADIPQVVSAEVYVAVEKASLADDRGQPERSPRRAGPVAGLDPLFRSLRVEDFATTPLRERQQGSRPAPPARLTERTALAPGRSAGFAQGRGLVPPSDGPRGVTAARDPAEPGGRPFSLTRKGTDVARDEDFRGVAAGRTPIGPSEAQRLSYRRSDRFAELVSRERLTLGIVLLSLLVAACLGGLHALSPGHGKTVVAAYLVGSRGTAKHALLLGLVVTASHTIGVFLLGIVTLALSKAIVPEKLYPAIQFLSGLTIVAIGFTLFAKRLRRSDPEGRSHSHAVEVPESAPTASALLALGVSGGILPCPSALVVLLSAIALHRIGFGLVLIVAFSAGLAAVLSGIGILVVRAGKLLGRFESAGAWARRLPAFSALLIGGLGLAIAARAFADVQKAFF